MVVFDGDYFKEDIFGLILLKGYTTGELIFHLSQGNAISLISETDRRTVVRRLVTFHLSFLIC